MKFIEEYKRYKRYLAIKFATRVMDQQSETLYEAKTQYKYHVQAIVVDGEIDEFMACRNIVSMYLMLDRKMRMYEEIRYDILEVFK